MTKADRVQAIPPATKCFVYNRPTKVPVVKLEPLTADMVLTKIEELKDSADARFNDLKRKFKEDDEDFFDDSWVNEEMEDESFYPLMDEADQFITEVTDVKEEDEPLAKRRKKTNNPKKTPVVKKPKVKTEKRVKDPDFDIKEESGGEDNVSDDDDDYVPSKKTKNKDGRDRKPRAKEKRKRGRPKGKAPDSKMNWMEAYYYFPQAGEKDRSKTYHCDKCVRLFEKYYVSTFIHYNYY